MSSRNYEPDMLGSIAGLQMASVSALGNEGRREEATYAGTLSLCAKCRSTRPRSCSG